MIKEGIVLFWIKEFQQCRSRISLMSSSNLVHFINKHQRIFCLALFESLNYSTRKCTNISSSVTFNLSNISQATNTETIVLSVQCSCNRFTDAGFTDTWRSHHAKNFSFNSST